MIRYFDPMPGKLVAVAEPDDIDRVLLCRSCGRKFVFTAAQQQAVWVDPKRCPDCSESRSRARHQRLVQGDNK